MTMQKYASRGTRGKGKGATCEYCRGTGRDLSRSLWGEFMCPVCGGTGIQERKFEVLTWDQTYDVLLSLADKIESSGYVPDVIIGVSSGGLIPARVLFDLLNVPVLACVDVGLDKKKGRPRLTQPVSIAVSDRKLLVVDEVVDTGNSLKTVKAYVTRGGAREVKTAAIYTKRWSVFEPDYFEKRTSRRIVFPWEIKKTVESIVTQPEPKKRKDLNDLESAGVSARLTRRFLDEIVEEECKNL
jgi:hypoxanthine phosphoribosyltransferase